jgi:hypothetical protein
MTKKIALSLFLASAVLAAHGAVDEDFMRSVEDTFKSADSNIGLHNQKAASADAQELEVMFREVVDHYVSKGDAEDGVKLSRKSLELSETLLKNLAARDFAAASGVSAELGRTCKSCHNIYKE